MKDRNKQSNNWRRGESKNKEPKHGDNYTGFNSKVIILALNVAYYDTEISDKCI